MSNFEKHKKLLEMAKPEQPFTQAVANKVDLSPVEQELASRLNVPNVKIDLKWRTTKNIDAIGEIKLKKKDFGAFHFVINKGNCVFNSFTVKVGSKIIWRFIFTVQTNVKSKHHATWMDDDLLAANVLIAEFNTKTGAWEFK